MQTLQSQARQVNIELLRILAMFFIVCNHILGHGLNLQDYNLEDPNRFFLWFLRGVSYTGTNIFVLITAYFQCRSQFKLKSLLLLLCQVWFYAIGIYFLSIGCEWSSFTLTSLFATLTPILGSMYWFVTCYVGLYVLSPFINKFIKLTDKRQLAILIGILFLFFSFIPNVYYGSSWLNWGGGCGIVWFIFLYIVAAYIRYYIDVSTIKKSSLAIVTFILMSLPLLSKIIIANVTNYFTGQIIGSSVFYSNNSILILPLSISFFVLFLKIKINNNLWTKIIAYLSSSMFSVYLISENPNISKYVWQSCSALLNKASLWLPVQIVVIAFLILMVCVIVDQFRKFSFKLISCSYIPDKILSKLSPLSNKLFE